MHSKCSKNLKTAVVCGVRCDSYCSPVRCGVRLVWGTRLALSGSEQGRVGENDSIVLFRNQFQQQLVTEVS